MGEFWLWVDIVINIHCDYDCKPPATITFLSGMALSTKSSTPYSSRVFLFAPKTIRKLQSIISKSSSSVSSLWQIVFSCRPNITEYSFWPIFRIFHLCNEIFKEFFILIRLLKLTATLIFFSIILP